jgi:hypothetical protein
MKNLILASIVLASSVVANAAEVTVLKADLPAIRGAAAIETRFYIDTEMKEAYADIAVEEQATVYVRECSYVGGGYGGYNGPGFPGGYRGPGYPYPGNPVPYCRTIPQTRSNTVLTNKVKISDVTMNGDDVIYQGADGDVVCGSMGRSRIFRVPTFYLSGKCSLDGKVVSENGKNVLVVKFKTK